MESPQQMNDFDDDFGDTGEETQAISTTIMKYEVKSVRKGR